MSVLANSGDFCISPHMSTAAYLTSGYIGSRLSAIRKNVFIIFYIHANVNVNDVNQYSGDRIAKLQFAAGREEGGRGDGYMCVCVCVCVCG